MPTLIYRAAKPSETKRLRDFLSTDRTDNVKARPETELVRAVQDRTFQIVETADGRIGAAGAAYSFADGRFAEIGSMLTNRVVGGFLPNGFQRALLCTLILQVVLLQGDNDDETPQGKPAVRIVAVAEPDSISAQNLIDFGFAPITPPAALINSRTQAIGPPNPDKQFYEIDAGQGFLTAFEEFKTLLKTDTVHRTDRHTKKPEAAALDIKLRLADPGVVSVLDAIASQIKSHMET